MSQQQESQSQNSLEEAFSNAVLKGYSKYLIQKYGKDRYLNFLKTLSITEDWVNDGRIWHSVDFAVTFYKALRDFYKEDPSIVSSCIKSVYRDPTQQFFSSFLGILLTPGRFFAILPQAVKRMNHYNTFEKGKTNRGVMVTTGRLVQRSIKNSDPYLDEVMAEAGLASVQTSFESLGYKVLSASTIKTPKEDGYAEFEITWVNRSYLFPFSTGTIVGVGTYFLVDSLAPLSENVSLILGAVTTLAVAFGIQLLFIKKKIDHIFEYQEEALEQLRVAGGLASQMNSQLLQFQEQTEQLMAETASEHFTLGIIHDMASPLTLMNLYTKDLEKGIEKGDINPEKLIKTTESLKRASSRMTNLIDLFRRIKKSSAENRSKEINIHEALSEIFGFFIPAFEKFKIKFSHELPSADVNISLPDGVLESIVLNIIQNATNALQNCKKENHFLSAKVSFQNDVIFLNIKDNGPGIPKEKLKELWTPFAYSGNSKSSQAGGMGFGLSFIKKMIDDLKGKIDIETSKEGTEFKIEIPVSPQSQKIAA